MLIMLNTHSFLNLNTDRVYVYYPDRREINIISPGHLNNKIHDVSYELWADMLAQCSNAEAMAIRHN